jgi:hypothetical protein
MWHPKGCHMHSSWLNFQVQLPDNCKDAYYDFPREEDRVKHLAGPDHTKSVKAYGQIPPVPDGRPAQTSATVTKLSAMTVD